MEAGLSTGSRPVPAADAGANVTAPIERPIRLVAYFVLGIYLGIVFTKTEIISWFRIQEMFRFDSIHMYGVLGSAVLTGFASLQLVKRLGVRSLDGTAISLSPKKWTPALRRYWLGGTIFGLGWAVLGVCPGPIFALIGTGATVLVIALVGALAGTWVYAHVKHLLPH